MCEINHQSSRTRDTKEKKNLFIKYKFPLSRDR